MGFNSVRRNKTHLTAENAERKRRTRLAEAQIATEAQRKREEQEENTGQGLAKALSCSNSPLSEGWHAPWRDGVSVLICVICVQLTAKEQRNEGEQFSQSCADECAEARRGEHKTKARKGVKTQRE
jgi:hypothetical protein